MPASHDPQDPSGLEHLHSVLLWWLVPIGLVVALLLVGFVTVSSLNSAGDSTEAAATARKLPPYWTVKPGETYSRIAQKTGLSTDQLETFNPRTDPTSIRPGQRLKLRLHVPPPRPKPLGPRYWTVRTGQSFGSISAETGRPLATLLRLNRKLKPEALRPGDKVRLRR